jgi:hypothetical protein
MFIAVEMSSCSGSNVCGSRKMQLDKLNVRRRRRRRMMMMMIL